MKEKEKNVSTLKICEFISYFFVFLMVFMSIDFVKAVIYDSRNYEVRLEADDTAENAQEVYRLYIDGEYYDDVDYNLYSSVDENGKTDYKFCYLSEQAKELCYCIIMIAMVLTVISIAKNSRETPFTPQNTVRIRLIGALQFALAIVPGLVAFIMRFFRFSYVSTHLNMSWLFMFVVGGVIMILAQVFDYGVKLQQDNDLIA